MKANIIGISGTNGSGKDSLGHIMAEEFGFLFITVTELLREEARQRGWAVGREQLRTISAEWRKKNGLGVLVDRAVEAYNNSDMEFEGLAMASLRNPGEVDRLHELGGIMVWIDGDPKIRYERIRNVHRNRDEEDNKTFEEFIQEEQDEMHPPKGADETVLDMAAVKEKSDIYLENNFKTVEEFTAEVVKVLSQNLN